MKKHGLFILFLLPLTTLAHPRDTCYTGLYIKNITDLRPDDYAWTASFWLWFNYRSGSIDPLKNTEIINSKQTDWSDPYYSAATRTWALANESGKTTLIHDWQLKNYPFDRQLLQIQLEAGLDTSKMILRPAAKGFELYRELTIPGWRIGHYRSDTRIVTYDADFGEQKLKGHSSYSRITYTIEIERKSWGLFFKLLIGLYISFFVAYMVFFVSPLRDQRFGLSVGGLFAAIGNKYVMDSNIPASISFSFVDKIHDLTFLFILGTLILSVYSLRIAERKGIVPAEHFDRRAAIILLSCYILMNLGLIISANLG